MLGALYLDGGDLGPLRLWPQLSANQVGSGLRSSQRERGA